VEGHTAGIDHQGRHVLDDEKFDLKNYPGRAGLFHSRTNSGGDDAWGHPFVGTNKKAAIVSQGNDGVFSDMGIWAEAGNRIAAKGKNFRLTLTISL
jgi:hypothetical protein